GAVLPGCPARRAPRGADALPPGRCLGGDADDVARRLHAAGGELLERRSAEAAAELRGVRGGGAVMRMRAGFVAALAALVGISVSPAAADRLDDIKARGKVIVGVSDTTPPFSFRQGDTVTGYDIDLVREVAKRIGVRVETVPVSSEQRIPMLKDGKL